MGAMTTPTPDLTPAETEPETETTEHTEHTETTTTETPAETDQDDTGD